MEHFMKKMNFSRDFLHLCNDIRVEKKGGKFSSKTTFTAELVRCICTLILSF